MKTLHRYVEGQILAGIALGLLALVVWGLVWLLPMAAQALHLRDAALWGLDHLPVGHDPNW